MRKKEAIQTISKHDRIIAIVCDICKKEYKGINWETDSYSALDTEVKLTTGSRYPEGGSGEDIEFDVCPKCFEEQLIPLLREKYNATPSITEWNY